MAHLKKTMKTLEIKHMPTKYKNKKKNTYTNALSVLIHTSFLRLMRSL